MSQIEELISRYCPDGVPYESLQTIGVWYGGGTPTKDRIDFWREGTIPWVTPKDMGSFEIDATQDRLTPSAILNSSVKMIPEYAVVMVVRSSILERLFPVAMTTVPVTVNQDMKAVVPRGDVLPAYLVHLLRAQTQELLKKVRKTGGSVSSLDSKKLFEYRIPVPPIEVQIELVRLLNQLASFETELAEMLKNELKMRTRQHDFYRAQLLTFRDAGGGSFQ